jgi:hypothetical protein
MRSGTPAQPCSVRSSFVGGRGRACAEIRPVRPRAAAVDVDPMKISTLVPRCIYMLPSRHRPRLPFGRSLAIVAALLITLAGTTALSAASASASQPNIEGVWTFGDGTIIVAPDASGQLVGTVAAPTTFDACPHPAGQEIWTDMQVAADGGYTGLHQWYRSSGTTCVPIPVPGPTAFRVLANSGGTVVLRVCFNHPGTTEPTIAPDGTTSNVNYGCTDSKPVSGLPTTVPSFGQTIVLPATSPKICVSQRHFTIHIREPRHDPFVKLTVYLDGRVLKVLRRGEYITAKIDLRGLPKGTYTVRIRARTAAGFIVKGARTYHTCVPKTQAA